MTDIVERLRAHYPFAGLPREAADEIERLRAALDAVRQWDSIYDALPDKLAQEVIRGLGNKKAASKETAFPNASA